MIKKILLLLVFGFICFIISLPFLLIHDRPLVPNVLRYDATEIDRAKALVKRNDPRNNKPGEMVTQWIDEQEISLILGYLINQVNSGGIAIELHPGRAYTQLSIEIPDNPLGHPFGQYLNFTLILSQSSNNLVIESLSLGDITLPGPLAEFLRQHIHRALLRLEEYSVAAESLNGLQILEGRMLVVYQWRPQLIDSLKSRGRDMLVDDALRERLLAYSRQIQNVSMDPSIPYKASLAEFFPPLFVLAEARGGDPVEENRAALLALAFYFSGVDIARMLGVDLPEGPSVSKRLTLSDRYDFAQHFLTSAALTLTSGQGLADSIGLFKELDDAKGGSGFSFTDIGADRTGVKAAELAINPATALFFQKFMTNRPSESDIIPMFTDLPELLTNEEFRAEFGGVGDPRYQAVLDKIESRFDQCPLYQQARNQK